MTILIIFVNICVWLWQFSLEVRGWEYFIGAIRHFGVTPYLILTRQGLGAFSSISSMFMHGDWWHLIGNMLPLWCFGRRVEDACGPWRFLGFYLLCGVVADIAQILINYDSQIPAIGASGAVFGLMGAYLLLYTKGRIRAFILFPSLPLTIKVRAYWIVLYFMALQILPACAIYLDIGYYSTGYWAHIGGFLGAIFVFLFLRPAAFQRLINGAPI